MVSTTESTRGRGSSAGVAASAPREGNQLPRALVPEHQAHAAETLPEREGGDLCQLGVLIEDPLQAVVGDPRVQMVDVVQADVAGCPLQNLGELVVGAALERRGFVGPAVVVLP